MTQRGSLVLMGGGGQAAVATETARAAGYCVAGCLDDDPGVSDALAQLDVSYLGGIDDLARVLDEMDAPVVVHVAVGDNKLRAIWSRRVDSEHPRVNMDPIIHPSAIVSSTAAIGDGVFVGPGAIVNARATIGRGSIINSGAIVEHDCVIGCYAHIAPGAALGGGAVVGEGATIGLNAAMRPGTTVREGAMIGVGAVVVCDIPGHSTATGVPARVIAPKPV